jgi:hypothetical protein
MDILSLLKKRKLYIIEKVLFRLNYIGFLKKNKRPIIR